MIVNPNGKRFGISIFQNREENSFSFSWELGKKDTTKYDIKDDFFRELIENFGWTFNFRDSFLSKHDFCSSIGITN